MNALPVRRPLGCLKAIMRQVRAQRQIRAFATETAPTPPPAQQPSTYRMCTSLDRSLFLESLGLLQPQNLILNPQRLDQN